MISLEICSSYVQFLRRGKLLTNKLIKQDYQQSVLKTFFVSSVVDTVTLSANKIFHWVACWPTFFILIFGPWFISLFSMDFSMINRIICTSGFCMVPHCVTSKPPASQHFLWVCIKHAHSHYFICPLSRNIFKKEQTICWLQLCSVICNTVLSL